MLQQVFYEQFVLTAEIPQAKLDDAADGPPPDMLGVSVDSRLSRTIPPRFRLPLTNSPPPLMKSQSPPAGRSQLDSDAQDISGSNQTKTSDPYELSALTQ